MKTGDLTSGAAKLQKAWEQLLGRWESTQLTWHDAVSQQFAEQYLVPLEPQLIATVQRMRALASMVSAAEQDCKP